MKIEIPKIMQVAVQNALKTAERSHVPLRLYKEAEAIRNAHFRENVGLEDIVKNFLDNASSAICMEIDVADARDAICGDIPAEREPLIATVARNGARYVKDALS